MLISLFLHNADGVGRASFHTSSAGDALEGIDPSLFAEHRAGGTGGNAHIATDAELLVYQHHALGAHGEGFGGAHFHAGFTLIANVHVGKVLGFCDADAGELRVIGLEIQVGTGALADVTGDALLRRGFQEFLHYPLLYGFIVLSQTIGGQRLGQLIFFGESAGRPHSACKTTYADKERRAPMLKEISRISNTL